MSGQHMRQINLFSHVSISNGPTPILAQWQFCNFDYENEIFVINLVRRDVTTFS